MKHLIAEAPGVADAFFNLTAQIRAHSRLGKKQNELVLMGIFTASRALKGIVTHVQRALEAGATKEEIISAIVLALPVVGIGGVNQALDTAMETIAAVQKEQANALSGS